MFRCLFVLSGEPTSLCASFVSFSMIVSFFFFMSFGDLGDVPLLTGVSGDLLGLRYGDSQLTSELAVSRMLYCLVIKFEQPRASLML